MFPNVNLFALIKIPFYHKLDFDLIVKTLHSSCFIGLMLIDYFDQFHNSTTIVNITLI